MDKSKNRDRSSQSEAARIATEIMKKIRESGNPETLDSFRRSYRKAVPLHMRAYVAAFLLKEKVEREGTSSDKSQTLFISAGKNRKVYPRDLARMFSEALKIDTSKLGSIKILDSYSFIDVPEQDAARAIELLNNSDFRGRKLTVNYARKKEEKPRVS